MSLITVLSDGVVTLRPPTPDDVPAFLAGHDEVSRRYIGDGDMSILPVGTIEVGGEVVGWVDHDNARTWLQPGELNVGYQVAPEHRGRGYAARGLRLLLHHLATDTDWRVATLLIDADNAPSLAVAARLGFQRQLDLDGHPYWKADVARFAGSAVTTGEAPARVRLLGPADVRGARAATRLYTEGADVDPARFLASDGTALVVAEIGVVAVGCAYGHELVHPDGEGTMLLYSLDVDERVRRRGIGRRLVEEFVQHARTRGCTEVWVLTDGANRAGLATYAAAGGRRDPTPSVMFTWKLADGRHS
jgi:RimJ/RimL family protein N-acetyltransferase